MLKALMRVADSVRRRRGWLARVAGCVAGDWYRNLSVDLPSKYQWRTLATPLCWDRLIKTHAYPFAAPPAPAIIRSRSLEFERKNAPKSPRSAWVTPWLCSKLSSVGSGTHHSGGRTSLTTARKLPRFTCNGVSDAAILERREPRRTPPSALLAMWH